MNISLSPELERLIAEKVESGQYKSADEVVEEGLRLLQTIGSTSPITRGATVGDIAEMVRQIAAEIPDSELDRLPTDLAANLDHYLYGSPKTD